MAWGDYDNDGYQDLFITNRLGRISSITTRVTAPSRGITDSRGRAAKAAARRVPWVDYDNDGDLDLFVANGMSRPI